MARSRDKRPGYEGNPLAKQSSNKASIDDGAILAEFVDDRLVSPQTIEKWAERDRDHEDFVRFLDTVNDFTSKQMQLARTHASAHPDAIEGRKTQNFRRIQYVVLMCMLPFIICALVYVTLPVATVLGIIAILIVSGVLVNGRDREMDLNGFVRMIHSIVGRSQK